MEKAEFYRPFERHTYIALIFPTRGANLCEAVGILSERGGKIHKMRYVDQIDKIKHVDSVNSKRCESDIMVC